MFRQMFEEKYMRFPNGMQKAATFSYDDGVKADKKLLKLFDKYGISGTFNLNSLLFDCENWHGRMNEEETFKTFANTNHEIALHGARHIFLDKVPLPEAINEIVQNRVYLERKFNRIVRGLAYAYNGYNDDVVTALKSLGIAYARTTESSRAFDIPRDWMRLKPTCHHTDPELINILDKFIKSSPDEEFKHREPWLLYVWGHSYEFDDDGNWSVMEEVLKKLSLCRGVWFTTNIGLYEYVQAYNNLVFSVDGERAFNPSRLPVFIEVRGEVYEVKAGGGVIFK